MSINMNRLILLALLFVLSFFSTRECFSIAENNRLDRRSETLSERNISTLSWSPENFNQNTSEKSTSEYQLNEFPSTNTPKKDGLPNNSGGTPNNKRVKRSASPSEDVLPIWFLWFFIGLILILIVLLVVVMCVVCASIGSSPPPPAEVPDMFDSSEPGQAAGPAEQLVSLMGTRSANQDDGDDD